jgi:hypothetical protein
MLNCVLSDKLPIEGVPRNIVSIGVFEGLQQLTVTNLEAAIRNCF